MRINYEITRKQIRLLRPLMPFLDNSDTKTLQSKVKYPFCPAVFKIILAILIISLHIAKKTLYSMRLREPVQHSALSIQMLKFWGIHFDLYRKGGERKVSLYLMSVYALLNTGAKKAYDWCAWRCTASSVSPGRTQRYTKGEKPLRATVCFCIGHAHPRDVYIKTSKDITFSCFAENFRDFRFDRVFRGQYLPRLSIKYVAINKCLEKLSP